MTLKTEAAAPWIAPELSAKLNLLSEATILALTLFGEARSEPIEGVVAVGNVVQHRAADAKQRWPETIRGVCLQPWQFSCWNVAGGPANFERLRKMVETLVGGTDPKDAAFEQCAWTAVGLTKHALRDRVKGANHYHEVSLSPRPSWAQDVIPTVQVAHHVFYHL